MIRMTKSLKSGSPAPPYPSSNVSVHPVVKPPVTRTDGGKTKLALAENPDRTANWSVVLRGKQCRRWRPQGN